jgi:hypothetical protein
MQRNHTGLNDVQDLLRETANGIDTLKSMSSYARDTQDYEYEHLYEKLLDYLVKEIEVARDMLSDAQLSSD